MALRLNFFENFSNLFNPFGQTSIPYPEKSTIRDKQGFLLELIHNLALKIISLLTGGRVESSCDDPETWKETQEILYDHEFGDELHESKNWGTSIWKSRASKDVVEREINERFWAEDPHNERDRVIVISDIQGFLPSAKKAIKGKVISIGFKVNEGNLWRAFRILLQKLSRRYDVWPKVMRVMEGVLTSDSLLWSIFSPITPIIIRILGPILENSHDSGKGPPDSSNNRSIIDFLKQSLQSIPSRVRSFISDLRGGSEND